MSVVAPNSTRYSLTWQCLPPLLQSWGSCCIRPPGQPTSDSVATGLRRQMPSALRIMIFGGKSQLGKRVLKSPYEGATMMIAEAAAWP